MFPPSEFFSKRFFYAGNHPVPEIINRYDSPDKSYHVFDEMIDHGDQGRYCRGNAGKGGPAGDLLLEISLKHHKIFEKKGHDIHITVPVTFGEAALGAKIEVPTIDGAAMMKLPPGTQGSQRFKLGGKGYISKSGHRGDEYVEIRIAVPKDIPEKAKAAVETIELLYKDSPRKSLRERQS